LKFIPSFELILNNLFIISFSLFLAIKIQILLCNYYLILLFNFAILINLHPLFFQLITIFSSNHDREEDRVVG